MRSRQGRRASKPKDLLRSGRKPMLSNLLSRVSVPDLLAIAAASCVIYGLSILHPAAPWIGAGVGLGFVSVELGKTERKERG